ncbi:MAG: hypothetical protein DHS20C05_18340 [Hyphococcus sp.]|nr:MAG: hypothetical protein DHS20C05_18340 [Marinicaulis sp.]
MRQVFGSASATICLVLCALTSIDILSRISGFEPHQISDMFRPFSNAIEIAIQSYSLLITDFAKLVAPIWGLPELLVAISVQTALVVLSAAFTSVFVNAK